MNELLQRCLADEIQISDWSKPLPLTWRKPRACCSSDGTWNVSVLYTDPRTLTTCRIVGRGTSFADAWMAMRAELNRTWCLP